MLSAGWPRRVPSGEEAGSLGSWCLRREKSSGQSGEKVGLELVMMVGVLAEGLRGRKTNTQIQRWQGWCGVACEVPPEIYCGVKWVVGVRPVGVGPLGEQSPLCWAGASGSWAPDDVAGSCPLWCDGLS